MRALLYKIYTKACRCANVAHRHRTTSMQASLLIWLRVVHEIVGYINSRQRKRITTISRLMRSSRIPFNLREPMLTKEGLGLHTDKRLRAVRNPPPGLVGTPSAGDSTAYSTDRRTAAFTIARRKNLW